MKKVYTVLAIVISLFITSNFILRFYHIKMLENNIQKIQKKIIDSDMIVLTYRDIVFEGWKGWEVNSRINGIELYIQKLILKTKTKLEPLEIHSSLLNGRTTIKLPKKLVFIFQNSQIATDISFITTETPVLEFCTMRLSDLFPGTKKEKDISDCAKINIENINLSSNGVNIGNIEDFSFQKFLHEVEYREDSKNSISNSSNLTNMALELKNLKINRDNPEVKKYMDLCVPEPNKQNGFEISIDLILEEQLDRNFIEYKSTKSGKIYTTNDDSKEQTKIVYDFTKSLPIIKNIKKLQISSNVANISANGNFTLYDKNLEKANLYVDVQGYRNVLECYNKIFNFIYNERDELSAFALSQDKIDAIDKVLQEKLKAKNQRFDIHGIQNPGDKDMQIEGCCSAFDLFLSLKNAKPLTEKSVKKQPQE